MIHYLLNAQIPRNPSHSKEGAVDTDVSLGISYLKKMLGQRIGKPEIFMQMDTYTYVRVQVMIDHVIHMRKVGAAHYPEGIHD